MLTSLIATSKRLGLDPFAYLREIFARISRHPQTRLAELLPDHGNRLSMTWPAARWRAEMAGSRRPPRGVWVYDPARAFRRSKKPMPSHIQHEVERRAQELIDSTLQPRYIQPPPQKAELNYLVDLYAKWRGPFLHSGGMPR